MAADEQITTYVDQDSAALLRIYASRRGLTLSDALRLILAEFLARELTVEQARRAGMVHRTTLVPAGENKYADAARWVP